MKIPTFAFALGLAAVMFATSASATPFASVFYDAATDQLVVTMKYKGTNPYHTFSLKWGHCKTPADGGTPQIFANVIDHQWEDPEQSDYQNTTRFDLAKLKCRPVKVTTTYISESSIPCAQPILCLGAGNRVGAIQREEGG